jgi:PKD repeat protein
MLYLFLLAALASVQQIYAQCQSDFGFSLNNGHAFFQAYNPDSLNSKHNWNFGDGKTSTGVYAWHNFQKSGLYNVTLNVYKADGDSCSQTKTVKVQVCDLSFNSSVSRRTVTLRPDYIDSSYSYRWNLGDGTVKTGHYVQHTYASDGDYTILLSKEGFDTCQVKRDIKVDAAVACRVSYSYKIEPAGQVYFYVNNASETPGNYSWWFGDGTFTSSDSLQVGHKYAKSGYYTVILSKTTAEGDTCVYENRFFVSAKNCVLNFSTAVNNQTVKFSALNTDSSGLAHYYWIFGDGAVSMDKNPSHYYANPGYYTVTLREFKGADTCVVSRSIYVYNPDAPCTKGFGFKTYLNSVFVNALTIDPSLYYFWNFGDGSYGSGAYAEHAYAKSGDYLVTLNYINYNGDTCSSSNLVKINTCNLVIYPYFQGKSVTFTAGTIADTAEYDFFWDFGDGSFRSPEPHVGHIYDSSGEYKVSVRMQGVDTCFASTIIVVRDSIAPCKFDFVSKASDDTVYFTPLNNGNVAGTYRWNFGDGTAEEFSQGGVMHIYHNPGNYFVSVSFTRSDFSDSCFASNVINVGRTVDSCNFRFESKADGLSTKFWIHDEDTSSYHYSWNFGDGISGSGYSLIHNYSAPGTYYGEVTRYSADGLQKCTKPMYIYIFEEKCIDFSTSEYKQLFYFFAEDTMQNSSYVWNFGDGDYGFDKNTQHYYSNAGLYNVTLTKINGFDTCTVSKEIYVYPAVNCNLSLTSKIQDNLVQFFVAGADSSTYEYLWNFGNGEYTWTKEPSVSYTFEPGTYGISVTTISFGDTCKTMDTITIQKKPGLEIHGSASASGKIVDFATVSVFKLNNRKYEFVKSDEISPADSGSYNLDGLEIGQYIIHVAPAPKSGFFFTHEPTYFGDVTNWQKAQIIDPSQKRLYPVSLVTSKPVKKDTTWNNGKDKIKGTVTSSQSESALRIQSDGEPFSNVLVTLYNEEGAKLDAVYTDENGNYTIGFTYPGTAEEVLLNVSVDGNESTIEDKSASIETQLVILNMSGITKVESRVYPNPASEFIIIENAAAGSMSVQFIDATGITVKELTVNSGSRINVQDLNSGVYMLRTQTGEGVSTSQFVKF